MKRVSKKSIFCLNTLLILVLFLVNSASAEIMDMQFDGGRLSASLKKAPLQAVCERIRSEKGIWFKSAASSAKEEISVQFTDLCLEDALKRILAGNNFSLMFDERETLIGAIIIGPKTPSLAVVKSRYSESKTLVPWQESEEIVDREELFELHRNRFERRTEMENPEEELEDPEVLQYHVTPSEPIGVAEEMANSDIESQFMERAFEVDVQGGDDF